MKIIFNTQDTNSEYKIEISESNFGSLNFLVSKKNNIANEKVNIDFELSAEQVKKLKETLNNI
jgi:hypothetical protein